MAHFFRGKRLAAHVLDAVDGRPEADLVLVVRKHANHVAALDKAEVVFVADGELHRVLSAASRDVIYV